MTNPATTTAQQPIAQKIAQQIADELGVREDQVSAAVELLDGGATVLFIARYRKEATGALDDAQLRTLEERLRYLRELDERRDAILREITAQGKLTAELDPQLAAADFVNPERTSRTQLPPVTAPAPSWSSGSPRTRTYSASCASRWPP